jgi:hypothetical protein
MKNKTNKNWLIITIIGLSILGVMSLIILITSLSLMKEDPTGTIGYSIGKLLIIGFCYYGIKKTIKKLKHC